MKMSLVDRDKEEKIIVEIEQVFKKFELMPDEKMFVINEIVSRINKSREKQKMSDLMNGGISGGLMKSIQKKFFEKEEK